uniref:WAT1-related protein n=1 Tax=Kalanchoe fedtschenkoi TaxID=63787 RepID=A0A7N0UB57_KALFE
MGLKRAAPFLGMVMAECAQAGLIILSKLAMADGISSFVFVLYSNAIAALVLFPISFIVHRFSSRPPFTLPVLGGFFMLGVLGCAAQVSGYAGINISSPTLGTAMLNLIPGFTFVLAVIFSMERLDTRSSYTLAKSVGTIVSIIGAFVVTLYKGPPILGSHSPSNLSGEFLVTQQSNWVLGGCLLVVDCIMAASWLILQASILKKYSAELVMVFFYCFFVAIQSAVICLVLEIGSKNWSLNSSIRLYSVIYSGVFGSAFQVGVGTWCLHQTGPVFVAMFKPLGIIITVAIGVIFMGETFYLGSLMGSFVIVVGFYSVMWGKAKEEAEISSGMNISESTSQKVPLLQNSGEGP